MIFITILSLAISAIHYLGLDSVSIRSKFSASTKLLYNNIIALSNRRIEFRPNHRGIWSHLVNRRTITPQIKVIAG
jgi:hypothetical protein